MTTLPIYGYAPYSEELVQYLISKGYVDHRKGQKKPKEAKSIGWYGGFTYQWLEGEKWTYITEDISEIIGKQSIIPLIFN